MPYLRRSNLIALARSRPTVRTASAELREAARSAPYDRTFDIFLSHSSRDAELIFGVKLRLEADGLSVYVDWIEDPQLDRTNVTKKTAAVLRRRMNQCRFLVYAASTASADSKWMPWELGYFDGRRNGRVGILPILDSPGDAFRGLEYLGLYQILEDITFEYSGSKIARWTGPSEAEPLRYMARAA